MTLIFPGQRLVNRMSAEAVQKLGAMLRERILDLESEHAPLFRAMSVWWKWYEAVPKSKEKNFPFLGASNVVVPLIGITCDALASRSLAQATAAAPSYWSCRSENEMRAKTARNMATYINWQADGNEFSLKHVLAEQFLETYVTGRSVCAVDYRHDIRPVFFGRTPIGRGARVSRTNVTFHRGPIVQHVPNEHILWDRRLRIGDAPLVVRRHEWTWTTLRYMAKLDDAWDQQAIREIQKHPGIDGSAESESIRRTKAELDLRDEEALAAETHDVRAVWVDWSMLGSTFEIEGEEQWGGAQAPLLCHLHMKTGRVLRLVGSPYLLPHKPFIDFRFRQGRGVAKRLEMLQSIQTTLWNQAIDSRTRSNAIFGKTRNARHNRTPIDPSKWLLVDDMAEIEPFNLHSSVQQDLPLLVAAQTMSERWMGQSDPLLGRDTRSGGHPSPATSTLALLEQVNVMSAGTDVIIQEELSRLGESLAILNQQFEQPDGRLAQILGPEDAASAGEYLFPEEPIPGNYYFDVVALSRTENPDAQMRRSLMVAQAYQNYGALAAQGAMVMDSPQASPRVKAVWAKLLDGYGDLLTKFLDASRVDDTEKYLVELSSLGIDARNAFRQFTAESAQAAAAAQGAGGAAGGAGGFAASGGPVGPGNGMGGGAGAPFAGGGIQ